jgi:RimK family alpha-L-glutamate ligase
MRIFVFYASWYDGLELIRKSAQRQGVACFLVNFADLKLKAEKGKVQIFGEEDWLIKPGDVVMIRSVRDFHQQAILVGQYCYHHKIPLVDHFFYQAGPDFNRKSVEAQLLHQAGLPYPKTFFGSHQIILEAGKDWRFPLILKDTAGKKGKGTFFIKSFSSLKRVLAGSKKREFLLQEYIPNDGDIRIFLVGSKILGAVKRGPKIKKLVLDRSLGKAKELKPVPRQGGVLAQKAASSLGLDIAGVDLVINQKTGKPVIIEVNRAPQFTVFMKKTGVNVPREIVDYLLSLKNEKSQD